MCCLFTCQHTWTAWDVHAGSFESICMAISHCSDYQPGLYELKLSSFLIGCSRSTDAVWMNIIHSQDSQPVEHLVHVLLSYNGLYSLITAISIMYLDLLIKNSTITINYCIDTTFYISVFTEYIIRPDTVLAIMLQKGLSSSITTTGAIHMENCVDMRIVPEQLINTVQH